LVTAVVVVLALAYVTVNKDWLSKQTQVQDHAAAIAPTSIAIAVVPQKSVAVLPFVEHE
jgi:hypothetical protein